MPQFDKVSLSISAVGTTATTGAASAVTAIPNDTAGIRARRVRLAAHAACFFIPGFSGTTCTTNDAHLGAGESVIVDVKAQTHIAHLQDTAAAKLTITPLEDG